MIVFGVEAHNKRGVLSLVSWCCSGDMDQDDGEYDEEVVEYLVNVEEVVLK